MQPFRIHMMLQRLRDHGRCARRHHVFEYRDVAGYLLPVRFHERVRGPLRIDAHTWWTTGMDTDRGWRDGDVNGTAFSGSAATPAAAVAP